MKLWNLIRRLFHYQTFPARPVEPLAVILPPGKHKLPRRERPAKAPRVGKKGRSWKEQSILSRYASEIHRSHEVAEERKAKRHQEAEAARIKLRQELADAERQRQRKQHNYWSW